MKSKKKITDETKKISINKLKNSENKDKTNPLMEIKNLKDLVKTYDLSHEHLTPILILRKQAEILELYLKILGSF